MKKLILLLSIVVLAFTVKAQDGGSSSYVFKLIPAAGTGVRIAVISPTGYASALANGANNTWLKNDGSSPSWSVLPTASTTVSGVVKVDGTSITINNGIISAPNVGGGTVVAVTGTAPIVSSGGNSPAISITAASQAAAGSMSSADKTKLDNLFNQSFQNISGTTPTLNLTNGVNANITLSGNTAITLSNIVAGMSGVIFIENPATAYKIKFTGFTCDFKGSNLTIDSSGCLCSGSSKYDSFAWVYNGSILKVHVAKDYTRITF